MELTAKGKGITPLVKQLRVKVREDVSYGLEIYDVKGIEGQEFAVIAIGIHVFSDKSTTPVAFLDTPEGIREVSLSKLVVVTAIY